MRSVKLNALHIVIVCNIISMSGHVSLRTCSSQMRRQWGLTLDIRARITKVHFIVFYRLIDGDEGWSCYSAQNGTHFTTHSRAAGQSMTASVADCSKHRNVSDFERPHRIRQTLWKPNQNKPISRPVCQNVSLCVAVTEITKISEQSLIGSLRSLTFSLNRCFHCRMPPFIHTTTVLLFFLSTVSLIQIEICLSQLKILRRTGHLSNMLLPLFQIQYQFHYSVKSFFYKDMLSETWRVKITWVSW